MFKFSLLVAVCFGIPVTGRPTPSSLSGGLAGSPAALVARDGPVAAVDFLRKYGYLETGVGNGSSETIYSEDSVRHGLAEMQRFGGLVPTGVLDEQTKKLLVTPRCGVPDVLHKRYRRYTFGSKGWNKRVLTFSVQNWSPKLGQRSTIADMETAFNTWAGYTNLKFKRVESNSEADIVISFGRGYHGDSFPFDGKGYTLAHAYFPSDFGSLAGDIHFDEDEDWWSDRETVRYGAENPISFVHVAAHELGHSLGLAHSSDKDSIMFPYYQGKQGATPVLGYDDIQAVYRLYVQRYIPDPEPDSGSSKSGSDESTTAATTRTTSTSRTTDESWSASESGSGSDENWGSRRTSTQRWTEDPRSTTARPTVITTEASSSGSSSGSGEMDGESGSSDLEVKKQDLCSNLPFKIAFLRSEIFVFRDKYMWRLRERGSSPLPAYPVKIGQLFSPLSQLGHIDAAYERETDDNLIFFSGEHYWELDGTSLVPGSPKHLTTLGLPSTVTKVDGVLVWGKNSLTYIFSGYRYWRYNETSKKIDDGYPLLIEERWNDIPASIDSVLRWKDGKTYFFQGHEFWRFDDVLVRAEDHFPLSTKAYWFNC